jgi:hypothetical protein
MFKIVNWWRMLAIFCPNQHCTLALGTICTTTKYLRFIKIIDDKSLQ